MKDFIKLQRICLSEVKDAGIIPGNIVEWQVNRRAKRRWGQCKKKDNSYIIQIAAGLLEEETVSEKACKETIIHEILHTCEGGMGHKGVWLKNAQIMNEKHGYNIKRTTSSAEKGISESSPPKSLEYKYKFQCEKCGQIIRRKKACRFTKYYRNYTCGICGRQRAFHKIR